MKEPCDLSRVWGDAQGVARRAVAAGDADARVGGRLTRQILVYGRAIRANLDHEEMGAVRVIEPEIDESSRQRND